MARLLLQREQSIPDGAMIKNPAGLPGAVVIQSRSMGFSRGDDPPEGQATRAMANAALAVPPGVFAVMHSGRTVDRAQILLRVMLLRAFCWVRSEWQLINRPEFDLLFWWFIEPDVDDPLAPTGMPSDACQIVFERDGGQMLLRHKNR